MRFLTYDELTPSMEVDRILIHLASFGGVFPRRSIERWRHRKKDFAEYVAVFAEERGRLLGQTFVLRVPYTFPDGTEFVSAIAAVGTRPDHGRRGVARAILTEVHRREREAGIRFSTLWTNRSWGAHGLYEQLGYRDVYSSPWVVHAPVHAVLPRPRGVRPARREDLADLERLHARQARGRLGFLREPDGYLAVATAAREIDPAKELVVLRAAGRLQGYARVESDPYRTVCGELVTSSRAARRALIAEVQRRAKRTSFAFQQTPVRDTPKLFRSPGYTAVPTGWYVLMANALGRTWSSRAAVERFATNDRRFLCMSGDRF
ncbi:MAG: GNAT family N-acetyltransferase [Thermoplasmata archaeon]